MVEFAALPVLEALPALKEALAGGRCAVLVAPPGAGKTTAIPLALLHEPWVKGLKIIVLEPRRLAARAAAARMAHTLGEKPGDTVGFRVRMQSAVSARTRIEVVTEGIFTRMILDDPGLQGVAAVIFDEFHERSLDADLGLALAIDAQAVLREDLRVLVMSATLDGARVARLLGDAPVIESQGRSYPVATRYLGRDPALRLEAQTARAIRTALAQEEGSVLVFLPGQGEIRRTMNELGERLPQDVILAPLYGALAQGEQDLAIAPAPSGKRKVVLATAIAETSLTIEGVRVVIDAGLSRTARYEASSGLTRLETLRVSRAAADQRRGRAGRTQPGVCYRLWEEAETRALTPFDRPEILQADLSGLALDLAVWGAASADDLAFLDPPPTAPWTGARALLKDIGALTGEGVLTAHGRRLAALPLPPRLAHMIITGVDCGAGRLAARIAVLLGERGLGGVFADLADRVVGFERDRSERARQAKLLADRWGSLADAPKSDQNAVSVGRVLLAAYPQRVAKRRGGPGEFRLASGRGVFIDPADALAREDWLVIADLGGGAVRDRILLAARIDLADVLEALSHRLAHETTLDIAPSGKVLARRVTRLDALVLSERIADASPDEVHGALMDQLAREGLSALTWSPAANAFRARVGFLRARDGERWPDLSDEALSARLDEWAPGIFRGARSLQSIPAASVENALRSLLPWDLHGALDTLAPARFNAPTGDSYAIDYAAEGGPRVDVRVQALYGLGEHPSVMAGRVPLTLALTSPAHRPMQVTTDLPGFWRGSWKAVRAEMRGRYPKHLWPEDPLSAAPTNRAKPRGT
jgi:ATP-dependent helicase HrpB